MRKNLDNKPKVCEELKEGAELSVMMCFKCGQQMVIEFTPQQPIREFKCCECQTPFSVKMYKNGKGKLKRLDV